MNLQKTILVLSSFTTSKIEGVSGGSKKMIEDLRRLSKEFNEVHMSLVSDKMLKENGELTFKGFDLVKFLKSTYTKDLFEGFKKAQANNLGVLMATLDNIYLSLERRNEQKKLYVKKGSSLHTLLVKFNTLLNNLLNNNIVVDPKRDIDETNNGQTMASQ